MARGRMQRQAGPRPGQRGGVCPFADEWSDEICGAEADHYSAAISGFLCSEHYGAVRRQFAAMAAEMATATCDDCGRALTACRCGQVDTDAEPAPED